MSDTNTFSYKVKEELSSIHFKKQCCRRALIMGILFGARAEGEKILIPLHSDTAYELCRFLIREQFTADGEKGKYRGKPAIIFSSHSAFVAIKDRSRLTFRCEECKKAFLSGLFIVSGRVNAPDKENYLAFAFLSSEDRDIAKELIEELGFFMSFAEQRGASILYLKRRSEIEDLLGYCGLSREYFEYIDGGMVKEAKNQINRTTNCIVANTRKSVDSASRYLAIIDDLAARDKLRSLPFELYETAKLRKDNPSLSLAALGGLFSPPISKSGVYHRLEKIADFYSSLDGKNK